MRVCNNIIILLQICAISSAQLEFDLKVDYYEKLIKANQRASSNYQPRTSNEDFLNFADFSTTHDFGRYDFIIVGAGSAGSVVANRLSEIKDWKILLLEAGGDYDDFSSIPSMFVHSIRSSRNWGYQTTPQKNAFFGIPNNTLAYPRGKILGGSSSINLVFYSRGSKEDYDNWEQLGNVGWSYQDVLPYFIKLENYALDDSGHRGFAGPLNVEQGRVRHEINDALFEANEQMGLKRIDYNGGGQIGVSETQRSSKFGARQSGANCYVEPAKVRRNFKLVTKAFVTRVLIVDGAAMGVEFVWRNQVYAATANLEVIVSAGATNTPQILMLSGVGPGDHLRELGIEVKADLGIGENLVDHPGLTPLIVKTNLTVTGRTVRELVTEFLLGEGAYTLPLFENVVSYINTKNDSNVPDVELIFSTPSPMENTLPMNTKRSVEEDFMSKIDASTDISITLVYLQPKSFGSVKLATNDPKDFPLLDFNVFADESDIDGVYRGVQFVKNLVKTPPLAKYNAKVLVPDLRQCREFVIDSKEHWYCTIKHIGTLLLHASSTTRMGPEDDSMACVDSNLRVYGIKKLRVADVGVSPTLVLAHTNALGFMIGEKAADIIKKDYGAYFGTYDPTDDCVEFHDSL